MLGMDRQRQQQEASSTLASNERTDQDALRGAQDPTNVDNVVRAKATTTARTGGETRLSPARKMENEARDRDPDPFVQNAIDNPKEGGPRSKPEPTSRLLRTQRGAERAELEAWRNGELNRELQRRDWETLTPRPMAQAAPYVPRAGVMGPVPSVVHLLPHLSSHPPSALRTEPTSICPRALRRGPHTLSMSDSVVARLFSACRQQPSTALSDQSRSLPTPIFVHPYAAVRSA